MSTELIIELWAGIKHLIPEKEQIHVADVLIGIFDDHGAADGIEIEVGLDPLLNKAVVSRFDLDEDIDGGEYDDTDPDW